MPSAAINLVSVSALPEYPIDRAMRLDGNSFVKWHTARWLSSKTFKLMNWEYQGMARALFDLCQNESPLGTLPDDNAELAFMLRVDSRRMAELRAMEFGPLRNWSRCQCEGEIRLMHPVVLAQVQDAIERRELSKLSKEDQATAKRLSRLENALLANGCSQHVVADPTLMQRIDAWISETHRGNRTQAVYRSALLHALQSRWFAKSDWADRT